MNWQARSAGRSARLATGTAEAGALRQELPITYLWNARNIVGMSAKLNGFRAIPDGMIRLQGLEMAK